MPPTPSLPPVEVRVVRMPPPDATLIVPGLWVGNCGAALSPTWLARHGVRAVFNCTRDVPFASGGGGGVSRRRAHYRVPVDDNLRPDEVARLARWAPEAVLKLSRAHAEAVATGGAVLVHCFAGIQRSAAVVAMLLMATRGMTADGAVALLRSRRPVTFRPFANFLPALRSWEARLRARGFVLTAYGSTAPAPDGGGPGSASAAFSSPEQPASPVRG